MFDIRKETEKLFNEVIMLQGKLDRSLALNSNHETDEVLKYKRFISARKTAIKSLNRWDEWFLLESEGKTVSL